MQLSIDYRVPYIRLLDIRDGCIEGWNEYRTRMAVVNSGTDRSWSLIEPFLVGMDVLYHVSPIEDLERRSPSRSRIARVEFIHRQDELTGKQYRGAVLFDNRQQPLIHVVHALLGYGGNGPGLSYNILTALGVPKAMFDEANTQVVSHDYDSVVFSRETIEVDIDGGTLSDEVVQESIALGGLQARPDAPVQDKWKWWIG